MDQERRLTNNECSKLRLPGRSPFPPHEELDWFPIVPAQKITLLGGEFETAAAILGDGREAAA